MSLTFGSLVAKQAIVLELTLARLPILAGYGFIFIKDPLCYTVGTYLAV